MRLFSRIDKYALYFGGSRTLMRLIAANLAMTLLLWILRLLNGAFHIGSTDSLFVLQGSLHGFITHPWTLATYMVTQINVLHLLFNMLWLYWFGRIVSETEGDRRLAITYLGGGILGGLFFIAASMMLPGRFLGLVGSSAAITAITVFSAMRHPDLRLHLVLFGEVKLKWLAIICVVLMLVQTDGSGSQIAHAGGIAFGLAYALWLRQRSASSVSKSKIHFPQNNKENNQIKIKVNPTKAEAINKESAISAMSGRLCDTDRLDELLDKVRVSGYDSLSPEEKRELNAISSRL